MKAIGSVLTFKLIAMAAFLSLGIEWANAQIPEVSSPTKEACIDQSGKLIRCGESFTATLNGVIYDCTCDCSSNDNNCTPRSESRPQAGTSSGSGIQERPRLRAEGAAKSNEADVAAEQQKQKEAAEKAEKERQALFEKEKDSLLSAMKGSGSGNSTSTPVELKSGTGTVLSLKGGSSGSGLGLKSGNSSQTNTASTQTASEDIGALSAEVTALKEKVPPPLADCSVTISDSDPLIDSAEYLMFLWDLSGTIGSKVMPWGKAIFIGYKAVMAGADQADLYLIKQNKIFNEANRYLKDPATAKQFAELLRSLKANTSIPASTDPGMLVTARAVSNPKITSSTSLFWDAMLSKDALVAMAKKAVVETGSELAGSGMGGIIGDLTKRKELYEATRIARSKAINRLKTPNLSQKETMAIQVEIDRCDEIISSIYRLKESATGLITGEITEGVSDAAKEKVESWKDGDKQ